MSRHIKSKFSAKFNILPTLAPHFQAQYFLIFSHATLRWGDLFLTYEQILIFPLLMLFSFPETNFTMTSTYSDPALYQFICSLSAHFRDKHFPNWSLTVPVLMQELLHDFGSYH